MANVTERIILEDGFRNAIVRLTGVLDTSDVSLIPAIALADFLNNDTVNQRLVGLRVDFIDFTVSGGMIVLLMWNGSGQQISTLYQSDELDFKRAGGLQPNQLLGGYTGGIDLKSRDYPAGTTQGYTVTLFLTKLYKS